MNTQHTPTAKDEFDALAEQYAALVTINHDMLAALRYAYDFIDCDDTPEAGAVRAQLSAAIAKAEGKQS